MVASGDAGGLVVFENADNAEVAIFTAGWTQAQGAEEGRFSGTAGSDEGDEASGGDVDGEVIENDHSTLADGQTFHLFSLKIDMLLVAKLLLTRAHQPQESRDLASNLTPV